MQPDLADPAATQRRQFAAQFPCPLGLSGEVIVARLGDSLCLNCLGRINPTLVAAYEHRADTIGTELVRKGYVTGQEVKEPAVKTLNSIVGSSA
ncbi:MAG: hypothetical protein MUF25_11055, partial [Pirellulaceae bacterium]|nr:hypothetical protein [Pirellulaceae bacterium]